MVREMTEPTVRQRSVEPLTSGLAVRRIRVVPREVVFVKGVIEASDGLAVVFAVSGGDLTIATPESQLAALDATLRDLQEEIGALLE
jgi:hypothetical protein